MFLASVLLFRSFICDSDGSLRALVGIDLSMVALVIVVCVLRTLGVGISFCTLGDGVGLITVDVGVLIITLGVGVMVCGTAGGLDVGSKVTCLVISCFCRWNVIQQVVQFLQCLIFYCALCVPPFF